jgi:YidC/Oxa1 family membrane protein insertase
MERNMLLAVVLSIAILVGYQYLYNHYFPPEPPRQNEDKTTTEQKTETAQPTKKEDTKKEGEKKSPFTPYEGREIKIVNTANEKNITVENGLMKVVFSTKGGTVSTVELKKYKDSSGNPIVLKSEDPLSPFVLGIDEGFQFAQVNFSTKEKDIRLNASDTAEVVFEFTQPDLAIKRTYKLSGNSYAIALTDEVKGIGHYWITLGKEFGIYEKSQGVHYGPVVLKDAERLEYDLGKVGEPKFFKEGLKWVAQEDKYFFSAIVPKGKPEEAKVWDKNGTSLTALKFASGVNTYIVFAGPKEYDMLSGVGYGLEYIVDFGFFSFLARPLFWVLKLFYSFTHNYGLAIIILTILVRIPFIPIINSGQKSMKKIQDIQPKMAEIKEKYKNDPQRMQQELMALYKTHKINPMSGCLPILLQIPVFFALYKVLLIAIELRNAPFVWWITDLSAKDPYYILPIIMGATMVIQQKMTPSAMDPTQQKIMMLMPVIFTFLFLTFPSGLVLYWLVNNILSIAQQYYINQKIKRGSV